MYNVFPLILARTTETAEAYEKLFKITQQKIEKILKDGIGYDGIKAHIEMVWASDLHTFWLISKNIHWSPSGTNCFCPYCKTQWISRHQIKNTPLRGKGEWKNVISPSLDDPWKHFVFCVLHGDVRGTEKLLELTCQLMCDYTIKGMYFYDNIEMKDEKKRHEGISKFNTALRHMGVKMFSIKEPKQVDKNLEGKIDHSNQLDGVCVLKKLLTRVGKEALLFSDKNGKDNIKKFFKVSCTTVRLCGVLVEFMFLVMEVVGSNPV